MNIAGVDALVGADIGSVCDYWLLGTAKLTNSRLGLGAEPFFFLLLKAPSKAAVAFESRLAFVSTWRGRCRTKEGR